jgi:hypothetical protein
MPYHSTTKVMENGVVQTASRFNEGKVDFTLLPIDALRAEALVWAAGRVKYPRDDRHPETGVPLGNWEKLWGENTIPLALACALRHINAMLEGELIDAETGQPHAANVRCNMAMIIRYINEKKEKTCETSQINP